MAAQWFENPKIRDGAAPTRRGSGCEASVGNRSRREIAENWQHRKEKGGARVPDTTVILGDSGVALETMIEQGEKALANVNGDASGDESLAEARRQADTAIGHGVLASTALLQGEDVGVSRDVLVDTGDNESALEVLQKNRDQIVGQVALTHP